MVEVSWTEQAIDDIDNIAKFIAKDSAKFARIQARRFFEVTLKLEKYPLAGKIVPEIGNKNIREIILGNYRIVYKIVSVKNIDIISIHHSSRLLNKAILKK
ncbi:MAG: type II toxin-antitoxin system RelE/ParE family toxin [Bacteroidetes bacterium]|nr:type II toxin-antitoxin system RelE/ParE family toxin [Bacteroidota bacterium]